MTKSHLVFSLILIILVCSNFSSIQDAYSTPFPYDTSTPTITWNTQARDNTHFNQFVDVGNNGTAVAWYKGQTGVGTLTKVLGAGVSTITLLGTPNVDTNNDGSGTVGGYGFQSNNGWIYVMNTAKSLNHYYILNGTRKHDFTTSTDCARGIGFDYVMVNQAGQPTWNTYTDSASCPSLVTTKNEGNVSQGFGGIGAGAQYATATNGNLLLWKFNNTIGTTEFNGFQNCSMESVSNGTWTHLPDQTGCDWSIQQTIKHYQWGIPLVKGNRYFTNSALDLYLQTDSLSASDKLLLTVDPNIIGIPNNTPETRFFLHVAGGDYLVIVTPGTIYYQLKSTILPLLQTTNRAFQSYIIIPNSISPSLPISSITNTNAMKVYGSAVNVTENNNGLRQIISGFTYKGTSTESAVRTVDPRWTNDLTDIPLLTTTGSLFPIVLTVSNAPQFSSIKIVNSGIIINGISSLWSAVQLDATHTAEFDLPAGSCTDLYVADSSTNPEVYNFEGNLCATGTNTKTIAYTNTLPISFWTSKYSATHSYTPSSNSLSVTTRATTGPFTENIVIKNNNGTTVQNFTTTVNGTIDTRTFNVTTVGKPLTLYVNVNGNPIYSAFLGSSVSFSSVSSFFATYFTYHGFNILSLIPIIFAGMFTRNSVGIGAVAVVLLIASFNFFSVIVVPEFIITIMLFISLIGLIAYRVILY